MQEVGRAGAEAVINLVAVPHLGASRRSRERERGEERKLESRMDGQRERERERGKPQKAEKNVCLLSNLIRLLSVSISTSLSFKVAYSCGPTRPSVDAG